jgi:hypothetical protein
MTDDKPDAPWPACMAPDGGECCPQYRALARERDELRAERDETYALGEDDGAQEMVRAIDIETGGDGEFRACLGPHDPDRHVPDAKAMRDRIIARHAAALARAEAAEAERDALRVVASAAEALRGADRLGYGVNDAFREMTAALDALPPGSLQSEG